MRVALMQPYYLPYVSYFDAIHVVDLFVIYDDVQFIKQGWINRNRIRCPKSAAGWKYITIPASLPSHKARICEVRTGAPGDWPGRHLRGILEAYGRGAEDHPLCRAIAAEGREPGEPLAEILERLLRASCEALGITTPIVGSRSLDLPQGLKGQDRVLAVCRRVGASRYLNPAGGRDLYDPADFAEAGIDLEFLPELAYRGRDGQVNGLSILDLCLTDGTDAVRRYLDLRKGDYLGGRAA